MKLNKYIYGLSVFAALALTACSEEVSMPDNGSSSDISGNGMPIELTVSRGTSTRATLTENKDGGLNNEWDDNDVIYIVNSSTGQKVGSLTLNSFPNTEDKTKAVFLGEATGLSTDAEYTVWYMGKGYNAETNSGSYAKFENGNVVVDLSNQDGDEASLEKGNLMCSNTTFSIAYDGDTFTNTSDVTMKNLLAMARFTLKDLEDKNGTLKITDSSLSEEGINGKIEFSAKAANNGNVASASTAYVSCLEMPVTAGKDVYVVLPTLQQTLSFEFEDNDRKIYNYRYFNSTNFTNGVYYCSKDNNSVRGIELDMAIRSAYDTSAWGADGKIIQPGYKVNDIVYSEDWGWMNNTNSVPTYGGWATWIEYTHNGKLASGIMVSDEIDGDGDAVEYYYQWGRYLGFHHKVGELVYDPYGDADGYWYLYTLGVDPSCRTIGVKKNNSLKGTKGICYISDMTKKKSIDCSLVFARITPTFNSDYLPGGPKTWFGRCGNPAPAGYRIPTTDDFKAIIPKTCENGMTYFTVNGSYSEIKEFEGHKYAMKWIVNSGSMPSLEIRSFITTEDNVYLDDPRFNKVTPVIFESLGYLTNQYAKQKGYQSQGWFWASDSYEYQEESYGSQLEIIFSGKTAKISIQPCEQAAGMPVMLIRDNTATPTSIKPLFPLTGVATSVIKNYPSDYVDAEKL